MGKYNSGTVKYSGYRGSKGKGMKNKRRKKIAKERLDARLEAQRRQREHDEVENAWMEEWGDY